MPRTSNSKTISTRPNYQEALTMGKAEYDDGAPKFYDRMEKFFAEYHW